MAGRAEIIKILQLAVGIFCLALVLRTWVVMGLVEPVTVAGSSMAPTLRGPFLTVHCDRCGHEFDIGAELAADKMECFRCGFDKNSAPELAAHQGDSLIIDRTAFEFRRPRRWEIVVLCSPEDGQLAVKRVVGLPGETIQLRDGDIWIDGHIAAKSLAAMRAIRQLVHEEAENARRWRPDDKRQCRWSSDAWHLSPGKGEHVALIYEHPGAAAITNDSAYNAALTRRLFAVRDFALSTNIRSSGGWQLIVEFANGGDPLTWDVTGDGDALLEVFAFDRRFQIYLDGQLYGERNLDPAASITPTAQPFALKVRQADVELRDLCIYHDIYQASEAEQIGSPVPMEPLKLGAKEIFVLGDNSAVSLDSRQWGPVPVRLLVGRPMGVR